MPSIFPLSPSTRNALPSGNAKKATSLTHTQWGEAGGSGSMVPAGSGGSCAQAVAPHTDAARASAAQPPARPRGWITSPRRAVPCSEVLTDLDADGARLIEEQPRPAGDFRGNRTVSAQVRHRVAEGLAGQRDLGRSVAEREACIEQAVGRPLARKNRGVRGAEAAADVGVVDLARQVPDAADRECVRQRGVTGPLGDVEYRRADRLRRFTRLRDLRVLVADPERGLQMPGGGRAQLQLPALALGGAGIGDELEAALQQNRLLDVVPLYIEPRGVQRQAVIEPGGLGAELVVPQRVGMEAAGIVERDVGVHVVQRHHAVVGSARRPRWNNRHHAPGPEALGGKPVDNLFGAEAVVMVKLRLRAGRS